MLILLFVSLLLTRSCDFAMLIFAFGAAWFSYVAAVVAVVVIVIVAFVVAAALS